jgi:hypothetical protein
MLQQGAPFAQQDRRDHTTQTPPDRAAKEELQRKENKIQEHTQYKNIRHTSGSGGHLILHLRKVVQTAGTTQAEKLGLGDPRGRGRNSTPDSSTSYFMRAEALVRSSCAALTQVALVVTSV